MVISCILHTILFCLLDILHSLNFVYLAHIICVNGNIHSHNGLYVPMLFFCKIISCTVLYPYNTLPVPISPSKKHYLYNTIPESRNRNEYTLKPSPRIYWRASLVPAAAVIPAPIAYIKVAVVKMLVVAFLQVLTGPPTG